MFYVATGLLFDKAGKLLIYLRDDKPTISFPNHWDLFGGMVEQGETPQQALVREVQEEIGVTLNGFTLFKQYYSGSEQIGQNIKYVYYASIDQYAADLKLLDVGQRIAGIDLGERHNYRFANILATIIDDFANANVGV